MKRIIITKKLEYLSGHFRNIRAVETQAILVNDGIDRFKVAVLVEKGKGENLKDFSDWNIPENIDRSQWEAIIIPGLFESNQISDAVEDFCKESGL